MKLQIAIVTGTRAEYGLLYPVIKAMQKSSVIEPRVIVTGAHLSEKYGNTVAEIEKDSIEIDAKIPILNFEDSLYGTAKTTAYAVDVFVDYFNKNRPAAVLVLGDRYEIFAVGQAAALLSIPLIHISGGDVTEGAHDDYFRHCLTKMASLHFPSCEVYANRLIAMGEQPSTVHNVGGLGDENLRKMPLLSLFELSESLGFMLCEQFALITFHPETASGESPVKQFNELVKALEETDIFCIFTKANADAGGTEINEIMDSLSYEKPEKYVAYTSMGALRYLSAMKYASVVIGNSSSGVVETPTLGIPCINIGDRQKGRLISKNIICAKADELEIKAALDMALTDEFIEIAKTAVSPYYGGNTAEKIVKITEKYVKSENYGKPKKFYDVKTEG